MLKMEKLRQVRLLADQVCEPIGVKTNDNGIMHVILLYLARMEGEMTVLYADDNHALIHECYDIHYGSCTKSDTNIEIITRNKELSSEARPHILDALYKACFKLEDLVLSVQEGGLRENLNISWVAKQKESNKLLHKGEILN